MRVLHIIPSIAPEAGGPSFALGGFMAASRAVGIASEVLTTDSLGTEVPEWAKRSVVHIQASRGPSRLEFAPASLGFLRRTRTRYDILHLHALWRFQSIAAAWERAWSGRPVVVRPCGALTPYSLSQGARGKAAYFVLVERPLLNRAASLHFMSRWEQEAALKLGIRTSGPVVPSPIEVPATDPPPRSAARAALGLAADAHVLVSVGRLHPIKRPELILEALAQVERPVTLALLGPDAGHARFLRELAAGLPTRHQVLFPGFQDRAGLETWYAAADAFVSTSSHENLGIAILEAAARGLPIVASAELPVVQELADRVRPVTPEASAVAHGIEETLSDPGQAREMGDRARAFVLDRYSEEGVGRGLRALYENVLARH